MQIHQLQKPSHLKTRKRVGRGGKRGTYSGRGMKGQKSRAGHRIRPQIWDYIAKIPKLRGMRRKPNKSPFGSAQKYTKPSVVLNVYELEKVGNVKVITPAVLVKKGLVESYHGRMPHIKILGKGTLTKPFVIQGIDISASAREKIQNAGGEVSPSA